MPRVQVEAPLGLAAPAAYEAVGKTLAAMAQRSVRGGVALTAAATGAAADVARIEVPVVLETDAEQRRAGAQLNLKIAARSMEALFPTFEGRVELEPAGSADSRIRMSGEYRVPLGALGAVTNVAALDRVAQESLQRFVDELATETLAAVRNETEQRLREARGGTP